MKKAVIQTWKAVELFFETEVYHGLGPGVYFVWHRDKWYRTIELESTCFQVKMQFIKASLKGATDKYFTLKA